MASLTLTLNLTLILNLPLIPTLKFKIGRAWSYILFINFGLTLATLLWYFILLDHCNGVFPAPIIRRRGTS